MDKGNPNKLCSYLGEGLTKGMNNISRIRNFSFWLGLEKYVSKAVVLKFSGLICFLFTQSLIAKFIQVRGK